MLDPPKAKKLVKNQLVCQFDQVCGDEGLSGSHCGELWNQPGKLGHWQSEYLCERMKTTGKIVFASVSFHEPEASTWTMNGFSVSFQLKMMYLAKKKLKGISGY